MFSTTSGSTGEKPQSKIWYNDGSYWAALRGPNGSAIYEKQGSNWVKGAFMDADLTSGGHADVKWNGSELFILMYTSTCKLFKYSYDPSQRVYELYSGFPVTVPNPSGSETMVLEQDSTGRLWTCAEGGNDINVYYSTSADHRSWSSTPIVLRSGVGSDDICSIVAFGGNKVGVFWSDQNRDEFGFRVHHDSDAPGKWDSEEVVDRGSGHADDHINLAFDSSGRVYAITKDDHDDMAVHRRSTSGSWSTKSDVVGHIGTRGIIMVAEDDSKVYILYTSWASSPDPIEYRVADINSLSFGGTTKFISTSSNMNNVTGMKQILPKGNLIAVASTSGQCWYNSFGNPPGGGGPLPPGAPLNLLALLNSSGTRVDLTWSPPITGSTPDGYNIYRAVDGGSYQKINGSLVATPSYSDNNPSTGELCYQVVAVAGSQTSPASNSSCVDNTPTLPPGQPANLVANLVDTGSGSDPVPGAILDLPFDEGTGQQAGDQSGLGHNARLGDTMDPDDRDPMWVPGVSGMALQFDGSNDYCEIDDSPSLNPAASFTVEAWVRWNGGTSAIVNKGATNERTYRVQITSSGTLEFMWEISGGSNRETTVSGAFSDAAWHHVACVYDQPASENRVYIDGTLRASSSESGTPVTNSKTVLIGAALSTNSKKSYLDGAIDGLHIVPAVLYSSDFTPSALPGILPPEALTAGTGGDDTIASQQVQLTWQAPSSGGTPTGYNVYRSENGGASHQLNSSPITLTSYIDTDLIEGELCYTVTALAQSLEGPASTAACVTVGTPPPPPPDAPTGLTAQLQGTTPESALLQWTAPTTGSPAVSYNVYRSIDGAAFQKINGSPVTQTSFTDASLQSGNHCYRVAAVDALDREGTPSASQCLDYTPPPPPAPGAPQGLVANLTTTTGGSTDGIAAYGFDDGAIQSIEDVTGNGHTGQLGSSPTSDSADPTAGTGISGDALLFDGSNDQVIVSDADDLHLSGSFTIEAWVQRGASGNPDCILSKGDSQQRNFWMLLTSSGYVDFRWETSSGSNHGTQTSQTITDSAWHHIACVYDMEAGEDRIYIDGTLAKSSSDSGTPTTSTDPMYVGARLSSGRLKDWFQGSIDLVRVCQGAVYTADFTPATSFAGGPPHTEAQLAWQEPSTGTPAGYNVYRQVDGGPFSKINSDLITETTFADNSPPSGSLCYQVTAVDAVAQEGPPSDPACIGPPVAKSRPTEELNVAVLTPRLLATPNPFNPSTTIAYRLPTAGHVVLAIYDVRGTRVTTLVAGERPVGEHLVRWNGRNDAGVHVASGVYFAHLRSGTVQLKQKLILLK